MITHQLLINLLIFANCIYRLQGFVFAVVYFLIERMSRLKTTDLFASSANKPLAAKNQITVDAIRANAERRLTQPTESEVEENNNDRGKNTRYTFNIFDGNPDENSPWAKFLNGDYEEDASQNNDEAPDDFVLNEPS
jgi:hypothetical protein